MAVAAPERSPFALAADAVHEFARAVIAGEIVTNRYVRLLCERHMRWLERDDIWFDAEEAGRAIRFFSFLRLHEGEFEGRPFVLAPWQAFIDGSIFGWYTRDEDGVDVRLIRNAYVETGKGSGKTPFAAGIGGYGAFGEGLSGAQVYSAAAGRDQSRIAWNDFAQMVDKSQTLRRRVQTFATAMSGPKGTSFTYVSSEAKNLHGKRVYIALVDEEHAHPNSDVIDAMRAGTKGWRNALIFRITNSGFDRNSICWADHQYSVQVLEGVLDDDSWFGYVAGLDMCEEHRAGGAPVDGCPNCDQWTDETVWPKANPNLGVSLPTRYLRELVREAQGKPSQQSIVKRLNFCIWTEGSGKWLDVAAFRECQDVAGPAPLPPRRRGFGGLDLASTTDLTAYAFVAPRDGRDRCRIAGHAGRCYDLRVQFWLPRENLEARVRRDHVPYDVWARDGWITLTNGNRMDRRVILKVVIGMQAQLRALGYDRWGMDEMVRDLQEAGFDREIDGFLLPVGQGFASMAAPAKHLETDVASHWVHHDGNPVLAWMVANAIADEDAAGNVKPDREKSTEKIDGVAAWCDALFAMAAAPPEESTSSAWDRDRSLTI